MIGSISNIVFFPITYFQIIRIEMPVEMSLIQLLAGDCSLAYIMCGECMHSSAQGGARQCVTQTQAEETARQRENYYGLHKL